MNIYDISTLLTCITGLFLGVFVFIKGHKQRAPKVWSGSAISMSIYGFGAFMVTLAATPSEAFLWWQISYIGIILIPFFFIWFVYEFLDKKPGLFILIFAFIEIIFLFSNLFLKKLFINACTLYFTDIPWAKPIYFVYPPGPLLLFFIIFIFFGGAAYGNLELIWNYKKLEGLKQIQAKYFIFSAMLGFIGGGTSFLPCFGISFYPILNFTIPFYFIVMGYCIVRHQLMDLNVVIRKTAIYSIVATIITIAYFILIYIVEGLFRGFMGYKSVPWTLSVIAIFTLIFQPLKNMVQVFIDRHFFKGSQALLQEDLKKAQEELKRSERLKAVGTLAAGMAHEIKNPLTGIKTFAEYLPQRYNDPEFRNKFHKIVINEVNKINDIVQQLLDFSKPKPLQLKPCNIHILLDQTLSFLNNDFIKNNVKLTKNYDSTIPLLNIDHNQIQQVFLNLFLNSIDAMKQGGTLIITTKLTQSNAEIIIQDTGTGISKKDLEHIFDPFYSTKEKGTGLGMSIVYGIIKEHKGEISVESEVNKGATFRIRL